MQRETPRIVIVAGNEQTTVHIGPGRPLDGMIFFSLWLSGWACAEVFCLYQLVLGDVTGIAWGFLCVWLAIWTLGGALAGYTFAFMVAGREHISLTDTSLCIDVRIARWSRSTTYPLAQVARMQRNRAAFEVVGTAESTENEMMLFEYEGRVVKFGHWLGEADVRAILDALAARVPVLVPSRGP